MRAAIVFWLLLVAGCSSQEERIVAARRELSREFPKASAFAGPIAAERIREFMQDSLETERVQRDLRDGDLVFASEDADKLPLFSTHSDGTRITVWRAARVVAVIRDGKIVRAYYMAQGPRTR